MNFLPASLIPLVVAAVICLPPSVQAQQKQQGIIFTINGQSLPIQTGQGGWVIEDLTGSRAKESARAEKKNDESEEAQSREQAMEARMAQLAELKLNRLPAAILENWYQPLEPDEASEDLPPAPPKAFLYSDVRFKIATQQLERDFTLGKWDSVAEFLKSIPKPHAKTLYTQILESATGSNEAALQGDDSDDLDQRQLQTRYLAFNDVFEIADIAPEKLTDAHLALFGKAFGKSIQQGNKVKHLLQRFDEELKQQQPVFTKRQVAKILFDSGLPLKAGQYLPSLKTAKQENDFEALNLLSRFSLAVYEEDNKEEDLVRAWHVTQAILAAGDVKPEERKQAFARAVNLSSQVSDELAQKWLNDSFVAHTESGMEVLGAIGADTARSLQSDGRSAETRLERLKLQNDAVNALLKISDDQSKKWQPQLNLLAQTWLREARLSYSDDDATASGPGMQRDLYGNIYYADDQEQPYDPYGYNSYSSITAIDTNQLLKIKPCDQWLAMVDDSLKPEFDAIQAQLYLKVSEQDLALPFIEKIGTNDPEKAQTLVDEFLTVWTSNHNPNSDSDRTNHYMFMYGYESRAESIPLTRSKQQRNLRELAELIPRLQKLVDEALDEDLIANAFFTCHSDAEVYQTSAIEKVFGPTQDIGPKTLAAITTQMRRNLATMWRDANVQKDKKTKRKKEDIESEIVEGYQTATQLLTDAVAKHPDQWRLMTTQAALLHDENNYRSDLENNSEFSPRRKAALALFKRAAETYVDNIEEIEEDKYTTLPFETWFYAALGASDLGMITDKRQSDPAQFSLIRETLQSLPEKSRKFHMDRFANLLFNRMSSAKPQLKFKYLDKGFEIVGDNENAIEAKKVHDYYKDLVNEIKLETVLDGNDRVGTEPFGVHVRLLHTKEIERESGGFGRYLQNQNNSSYFSYNYGRPTEDYRDKFEESAQALLEEQFEVLSITFQKPDVESLPTREIGWRTTPYAYLLLKAKGPEVDKLPPVKLDLDFLDTSGYAILPVESATLPIDATEKNSQPRPFENLRVTEILDERQAQEGKLVLEINAQAQGLVPELNQIMEVNPQDFYVESIADNGVSVSQFDPEESQPVMMSEREWVVTLVTDPQLEKKPTRFRFPVPLVDTKEVVYQRYVDADLATVEESIALEEKYTTAGFFSQSVIWAIGLGALLAAIGLVLLLTLKPKPTVDPRPVIDEDLSPFAALSVLQDIYSNNGLSDNQKTELKISIDQLEKHYFGLDSAVAGPGRVPDLNEVVQKWSRESQMFS